MINRSIRCIIALLLLVAAFPATSAPTLAQLVDHTLVGLAVNPTTNRIYVADASTNTVHVIDGTNNSVAPAVSLGGTPVGLATNPTTNRIYVAHSGVFGFSLLSVIDAGTNTVVTTIQMIPDRHSSPVGADVNPTTNRIYDTTFGQGGGVGSVIDGATNAIVATFPAGRIPVGAPAVNPTTNRIYVPDGEPASGNVIEFNIIVVDGATNKEITTIPLTTIPSFATATVVVNPATNRIYAAGKVIDGATNKVVASTPTDAKAVNPTTNRIYGPDPSGANSALVVDGTSNAVLATVPLGFSPSLMAVNPETNRIYAASTSGTAVSVIDGASNAVISTIPIGSRWFFAEGSTQPPFDTWFLVENPTSFMAHLNFTFFVQPSGTFNLPFDVGPHSRFSLFANSLFAKVNPSEPERAFSTRIDSNVPVFAERAMYVSYDGDVVTGIPAPNKTWLFAEGATVQPFHTWLLLQNPGGLDEAKTTITYLLENGQIVTQTLSLPSNSRTSIFVNDVLPNAAFSSRVESDQPIIAERAMYRFPGNAATVNNGVNAPAKSWFFSEGRTDFRGLNADTFLLLENPSKTQATATITLFATDGRTLTFDAAVLPTSRLTLFINPVFGGSFGIKVTSDQPIIGERSVFFGNEPLGAYSTQGATALSTSWHFADGETRDPFDELITVLNPQGQTMGVHIDFELENGQVIGRDFSIAPNSKLEVLVDDILDGANSATVTTSLPSVAERTMFIFKQGSIGATDTIGVP